AITARHAMAANRRCKPVLALRGDVRSISGRPSEARPGREIRRGARDRAARPRRRIYAGAGMADLVDRIRRELDARIEQLRPLVAEFERLERAAAALARAGARARPGVGPRVPVKPD